MFGFIAVSGIYVFGTLLTANGSLKQLNIIAAFAILFNLTVNIILIPKIQAVGSAYASLSAQFISVILQIVVVQRIFKFRINLHYLASLALFAALVVLGAWFSRQLPYSWWINAAMVLAYSLILAILIRLFNIRGLIAMIRERESEPPE